MGIPIAQEIQQLRILAFGIMCSYQIIFFFPKCCVFGILFCALVCLFACLLVCLFACLLACQFLTYLFVCLLACLLTSLFTCSCTAIVGCSVFMRPHILIIYHIYWFCVSWADIRWQAVRRYGCKSDRIGYRAIYVHEGNPAVDLIDRT
jgi:hypothetical protein